MMSNVFKKWWIKGTCIGLAVIITSTLFGLSFRMSVKPTDEFVSISLGSAVHAQEPSIGEVVEMRTKSSKTNYLGSNRYSLDTKIGSVHYKDNENNWQDIDNSWWPATAPWDWEMRYDDYQTKVLTDFTAGQILKFESKGSSVAFQPMALQWTNDLDQIQQISMPQSVVPALSNIPVELLSGMSGYTSSIRWENAYGAGIHFEWANVPNRLNKLLQLDSEPPVPPQYIIDGGNPMLELNFIFAPSSGLDIYVDGQLWDKSSKKQTVNVITFKDWYFLPVKYWDSSPKIGGDIGNEGIGITELRRVGNDLYISALVPYSWLQTAAYPVFIDPSIITHDTPKTLYFESVELSSKVWQAGEAAPSSADEVTSIKSGTGTVGRYYSFVPGVTDSTAYDTSFIEGDADGAHGWRSEVAYSGSFLIDNWVISFKLKNRMNKEHAGEVHARVYKTSVANPAVGDLTKLNAVDGASANISFSATADEVKTGTVNVWANQSVQLDNEYLFIILNWKVTTAGSNPNCGVKFVTNEGSAEQIVTADYFEGSLLEVQVGASADDAYYSAGDSSYTADYVRVDTSAYTGGLRFQTVNVPNGATIDVCYVSVYCYSTSFDSPDNDFDFEDVDDAADFSGRWPNAMVTTGNPVEWDADNIGAAAFVNSPSLVTPCQAVVNRGGWAANQDMAVQIGPDNGTAAFAIWSWDGDSAKAAKIHIEYTAGGEPDIIVSPLVYDFGVVAVGSTTNTTTNYFTITNNSTIQTDQTISVTTTTWSGGLGWDHSDNGTAGDNTTAMYAYRTAWDVIVKNASPNFIYENCPASTNYTFGLSLQAPTVFYDGAEKTIVVRITATSG